MSDDERERADRFARVLNEAGHDGATDWRVTAGAGEWAVIVSDANEDKLAMECAEQAVRAIAGRRATLAETRWVLTAVGGGPKRRREFKDKAEARAEYARWVERADSTVALYRLDPLLIAKTEPEAAR